MVSESPQAVSAAAVASDGRAIPLENFRRGRTVAAALDALIHGPEIKPSGHNETCSLWEKAVGKTATANRSRLACRDRAP